jgi:hypothetical protein
MRVRVMLDVWLEVDADNEAEARAQVELISDAIDLEIDEIIGYPRIVEVEA